MVGNAKKLRCSEWFLEQGQSIDHFVEIHAADSSVGCDRLHLRTLPAGNAIRLGSEVITADNVWAYVAELSSIAGAMSPRGVVLLQGGDRYRSVDVTFVLALAEIMNVDVIAEADRPVGERTVGESDERACVDRAEDSPVMPSAVDPAVVTSPPQSTSIDIKLTSRDHHSAVFDLRRSMHVASPTTASMGMVIKHAFDLAPVVRGAVNGPSMVVDLGQRLRGNEMLLGQAGDEFWKPMLVNIADDTADAIPLMVMRGDQWGTIGLATSLGFDLAVIDSEVGTQFHLNWSTELQQKAGPGQWRVLVYSRVIEGMVPIISVAPPATKPSHGPSIRAVVKRGRRPVIGHASRPLPAASRRRRLAAVRIDQPHSVGPSIERPHRSQASRPANYSEVLRTRHLSRQPHRTSAAHHE